MPVTIKEAIDAYLAELSTELSDSSIQNHHFQLKQFRLWAGGAGGLDDVQSIEPIGLYPACEDNRRYLE